MLFSMVKAIVTEDRKVAIPDVIRERFGLTPGAVLLFDDEASSFQVTAKVDLHRMRRAQGVAKDGLPEYSSHTWLDETRDRSTD